MEGDKGNTRESDVTELPERGKYNHLPEDTATSNMVGHKGIGDDGDAKHSPEGGKLLACEDGGVSTEVKFISPSGDTHNNGDANISIEAVKIAFAGMGKEELMKFANDPFWIRLRWFLFIIFWLIWAGMLAIAIVIIVLAPKCAAPAPKTWWEESPLYQIYVPSFKDGEANDGKGDLKGIQEKLDYLVDLGIQGVAISSIMKTSNEASDDTVESFIDIDPEFGTLADFVSLTSEMNEKGIHLIMRFVPNHSSSKHPWFLKSVKKEDPYTDYYVWAPKKGIDLAGETIPPNNWLSLYGDSAWEWNSERDAFYLHQFGKDQPDLNFRNPHVIEEFKNIFKFWIQNGASGFQLDKIEFLLEDEALQNETTNSKSKSTHDQYDFYSHDRTLNVPGVVNILKIFKEEIKNLTDSGVLAVTANISSDSLLQYYGEDSEVVVDLPFNYKIQSYLREGITAFDLSYYIGEWLFNMPNGTWPNWEIGNSDISRLATRVSPDMVDGIQMVFMLLPGTPITYYGDELAMEDLTLEVPYTGSINYHPARGLMQWSNSTFGGFSDAPTTWIKAADSYAVNNVERQQNAFESHYKVYKALVEARKSPSIMYGSRKMHIINETVLAYNRVKSGSPGYLVLFNIGDTDLTVSLSPFSDVPEEVTVLIRSVDFKNDAVQVKSKLPSDAVSLASHDALVITYVPSDKKD